MGNPFRRRPTEGDLTPAARARRFLILLLALVLPCAAALLTLFRFDRKETLDTLSRREQVHLAFQRSVVQNNFSGVFAHLAELSANSRLLRFIASPEDRELRDDTVRTLLTLCRYRGVYKRITLIDVKGRILLRVWDLDGTDPFEGSDMPGLASPELDAFSRTMELPTGEVFVQDIKLDLPVFRLGSESVSVLRIARRLRSPAGDDLGVIFLNYDFKAITRDADRILPVSESGFLILREDGRILNIAVPGWPQSAAAAGGSFPDRYPETWRRIDTPDQQGQFLSPDEGMFTYEHLYPFKEIRLLDDESIYERDAVLSGIRSAHHWVLASHIDWASLDRTIRPIRRRYVLIGVALFVLLCLVCAMLASYDHHRLASELRLERTLAQLDGELENARQSIESLIPRDLSGLPGVVAASLYRPSSKVGGDLFDLFALPDGRTRLFLFDLMGHGVAAALGTAFARSIFRRLLADGMGPAAVLATAGDVIAREYGGERFLTAIVAEYDPEARTFRYAAAGCPPPILERPGEPPEALFTAGLPVGILAGTLREELHFPVPPGTRLTLYTDGLVDHRDATRAMFGEERLRALLAATNDAGPASTCEAIAAALDAFGGATPAHDDVTLLVLRFS